MAKKTYKSTDGTSFFGTTIRATVNQLISAFGDPTMDSNWGDDKVNFEWEMETEDGEVFTIYDWKEGRPLGLDEYVVWHIGAMNKSVCNTAEDEILEKL
jgi:hypothetical protein